MDARRGYGDDTGFPVLLIADAGASRDAEDAVALAGGRTLDRLAWDSVAERLGDNAAQAVLLVEVEGVAADVLIDALPLIDAYRATNDARIVVAMGDDQIDQVAATLLHGRVQLLCRPTIAERVTALIIAGEFTGGVFVSEAGRNSEAARLRQLNEEVARIAHVLTRLTTNQGPADESVIVQDRRLTYGEPPRPINDALLAEEVRAVIRSRRMRDKFLGTALFEDPAWDMLLDLYAAELERAQVSVSSLCIAAAVAPTTALRWIGKMSEAGLLDRQPDPFDRRRAFMALSDRARDGMRAYCAAVKEAGLGIA